MAVGAAKPVIEAQNTTLDDDDAVGQASTVILDGVFRAATPRVLVVEDDEDLQRALGRLLRLHRFTAVSATTIAAAIRVAEDQRFDVVILDLSLRGRESGLDFLVWLRQHSSYAEVPILIHTGQTALGETDEALIRRHRAYVFSKLQPITILVEHVRRFTRQDA